MNDCLGCFYIVHAFVLSFTQCTQCTKCCPLYPDISLTHWLRVVDICLLNCRFSVRKRSLLSWLSWCWGRGGGRSWLIVFCNEIGKEIFWKICAVSLARIRTRNSSEVQRGSPKPSFFAFAQKLCSQSSGISPC